MAEPDVDTDDLLTGSGTDPDDANPGSLTGTEGQFGEPSAGGTE